MPRADRLVLLAAAAALPAMPASAACTVSTAGVAFGAYNPQAAAPRDGVGTITVDCDKNERDVEVTVSRGSSGSYAQRRMTSGSAALAYNLYTSAARTQVLGNGSGGTGTFFFDRIRRRDVEQVTVYGRIPARQNVRAGTYTDTLIVTVSY